MGFRDLFTQEKPGLGVQFTRCLLRTSSIPYGLVIRIRNWLYDRHWKSSHVCGIPVISVGNLSVGGTGKSPFVSWLVRWFRSHNIRVAVLSRGYGQLDRGQNDEALELELRHPDVPHLQHWDRIASAEIAEQELEMQALVLDDAFQHRRISRDLDIVLLDATDSAAARWLLPGGLYREPASSLRRADFVVLTRANQADERQLRELEKLVSRNAPQAGIGHACHRPNSLLLPASNDRDNNESPLGVLKQLPVLASCGIGNPDSFYNTLLSLGATVIDRKTWPDHHAFSREDVNWLAAWCSAHPEAKMLVCTMKDWVKLRLPRIGNTPLGALEIQLQFMSGEQDLVERLKALELPYRPGVADTP